MANRLILFAIALLIGLQGPMGSLCCDSEDGEISSELELVASPLEQSPVANTTRSDGQKVLILQIGGQAQLPTDLIDVSCTLVQRTALHSFSARAPRLGVKLQV